jgi:hypothetical protein
LSPLLQRQTNSAFGMLGASGPVASFESIASVTADGSSGFLTLSSIPQTYKHLQIRGILRNITAKTITDVSIRLNENTNSIYSSHYLRGNGSAAASSGAINQSFGYIGETTGADAGANIHAPIVVDILDYTNTNKYKTIKVSIGHDLNAASTNAIIWFSSVLFASTSAITSFSLFASEAGNFSTTSKLALYGIKE